MSTKARLIALMSLVGITAFIVRPFPHHALYEMAARRMAVSPGLTGSHPRLLSGQTRLVSIGSRRSSWETIFFRDTISLLSLPAGGGVARANLAKPLPETLAVAIPENNGITLHHFLILSDGSLTPLSRSRLSMPESEGIFYALDFAPRGGFAYLAAYQSGKPQLTPYRVAADGSLTALPLPSVPYGANNPFDIYKDPLTFSPDGRFAYAVSRGGLWQYRVGDNGALTPLAVPVVKTGQASKRPDIDKDVTKPGDPYSTYEIENGNFLSPVFLTFDPGGRLAYVINDEYYYKGSRIVTSGGSHGGGTDVEVARTLVTLRVQHDGSLTPTGIPAPLPEGVTSLTVAPGGHWVAASGAGHVALFAASKVGNVRPPACVAWAAMTACFCGTGRDFYIATANPASRPGYGSHVNITRYHLARGGSLAPGQVFALPRLGSVTQMSPDRTGRYLCLEGYTSDPGYGLISLTINHDGTLAADSATDVPIGSGDARFVFLPGAASLTPRTPSPIAHPATAASQPNEFAYALNTGDNTISQYGVRGDGSLQPLTPPVVPTGRPGFNWPEDQLAVGEAGRFLYVTHTVSGSLDQYRINQDGTLAPLSPATVEFGFGNPPNAAFADPADHLLFVTDRNNPVYYLFHVQADGTLTPAPAQARRAFVSGNGSDSEIAVNPATHLFSFLHGNDDLDSYRIGPSGLTHLSHTQTNLPSVLTYDPTGRFVYYGDGGAAVWQFRVGPDGAISENTPRSVPADERPENVALTPDGRFAYAADVGDFYGDGGISQYRVNADGTLKPLTPPTLPTGTSPHRLAVDAGGHFLYALSASDANGHAIGKGPGCISEFRIGPDGRLTPLVPASVPTGTGPGEIVVVHR